MSGLIAADVVAQAKLDKELLESMGFEVLCPVLGEGVKATKKKIDSSKELMDIYWARDKEMIRNADVVFNMSPNLPSIGVIREHGYARYHLWKKVISVFPKGKMPRDGAICYYEDDFVTDSLEAAAKEALRTHGTFLRRLKWRLQIYNKSLLKSLYNRLCEWK